MADEILTVPEVAQLLKVAEKTVYTMAQRGEIPCFKVRGQWRFRRQDIGTCIASQTRGGVPSSDDGGTMNHNAQEVQHALGARRWPPELRAAPERTAADAAHSMVQGMISKFQPCLPGDAKDRLLAERLLDLPATLRFLANVKVNGRRAIERPRGLRLVEGEDRMPATLDLPFTAVTEVLSPRNEIQWIDTPAALRGLCQELLRAEVVGLGVETALDFGTLCLLQAATKEHTYLIDPFSVADLTPLFPVFDDAEPIKVIHNARFEQRVLAAVGLALDGVFDTMEHSKRLRGKDALGGHSLATVCERELGASVDKSQQTSNWSRRPLDADQLRYAALNAEVLLRLNERFVADHVSAGPEGHDA